MTRSNIHDRLTIKSIYPRDAFEVDSRRNAEIRTGILHGLKITSPPRLSRLNFQAPQPAELLDAHESPLEPLPPYVLTVRTAIS